MLVDDVPQVVFDAVRGLEHVQPRRVIQDEPQTPQDRDRDDERREIPAWRQAEVDGLPNLVRDQHLDDEADERRDERQREDPLVGERDREHAAEPGPAVGGLDVRARCRIPRRDADRNEGRRDVEPKGAATRPRVAGRAAPVPDGGAHACGRIAAWAGGESRRRRTCSRAALVDPARAAWPARVRSGRDPGAGRSGMDSAGGQRRHHSVDARASLTPPTMGTQKRMNQLLDPRSARLRLDIAFAHHKDGNVVAPTTLGPPSAGPHHSSLTSVILTGLTGSIVSGR